MRVWALLLCLPVVVEGSLKKQAIIKVPRFYTSSDCSGAVDEQSMQWGHVDTPDNHEVITPFADKNAYMKAWVYGKCLGNSRLGYSVKVVLDEEACRKGKDKADQFVLEYYTARNCRQQPVRVPLTLNKCVKYQRGSVKLTTQISSDDMCLLTDFVSKMTTSGTEIKVFAGSECKGPTIKDDKEKAKWAKVSYWDEVNYDDDCTCCKGDDDQYNINKMTCKRAIGHDSWDLVMQETVFADSKCTEKPKKGLGGFETTFGSCTPLTANGASISLKILLLPPLTPNIICNALSAAQRNNIEGPPVVFEGVNPGAQSLPNVIALLVALLLTVLA